MKLSLKTPKAVWLARESKGGLHWALEILIFIALFLVCTIGEVVVMLPVQAVMLMDNQSYLDAVASGDVNLAAEAAVSVMSTDTAAIASLFATAVMILLVFLFCRLIQKRKPASLGFVMEGSGKAYAKGIVIGFLMFSAAVLICILTGALQLSFSPERFTLSTFLLFTVGYMVQGMAEEVLCRGYFMVSFGRRYSMTAAALINACAFAALHLLNPGIAPLAILNLVLFGVFASLCFIKTENIWMVGAIHSVWNLVQGNLYGVKVSGMATSCTVFASAATEGRELFHGGDFGLEGGLGVTIVLAVGILILWKKCSEER